MKYQVSTVLNQLLDFIPRNQFESFVGQHKWDRYTKYFLELADKNLDQEILQTTNTELLNGDSKDYER